LLKVRREGGTTVAGRERMTIEGVVREVLLDEHADVLRESLRLLVREVMEVEVAELVGGGAPRAASR
jgi:hypothetical protein